MKKNDIAIYTICGQSRQVKIISEKINLAYNGGTGYKIRLPDGQKIYVSDKNLSKIEPENKFDTLRVIKSTAELTQDARTPDGSRTRLYNTDMQKMQNSGVLFMRIL